MLIKRFWVGKLALWSQKLIFTYRLREKSQKPPKLVITHLRWRKFNFGAWVSKFHFVMWVQKFEIFGFYFLLLRTQWWSHKPFFPVLTWHITAKEMECRLCCLSVHFPWIRRGQKSNAVREGFLTINTHISAEFPTGGGGGVWPNPNLL